MKVLFDVAPPRSHIITLMRLDDSNLLETFNAVGNDRN